jgi:hypothetical protein
VRGAGSGRAQTGMSSSATVLIADPHRMVAAHLVCHRERMAGARMSVNSV